MQNEAVADLDRIEAPALSDHDLTPEECMALARSAAERVELGALERGGEGSFALLWRDDALGGVAQHVVGASGHGLP